MMFRPFSKLMQLDIGSPIEVVEREEGSVPIPIDRAAE